MQGVDVFFVGHIQDLVIQGLIDAILKQARLQGAVKVACLGIEHLSFGVADEQAGERVFQLFIFAEIMLEGLFAHTDIRVAQEFMIGRSVEELLFTVDLHIFIGEPDALEGLVRDSGDLIDLAHEGFHLVAETVRDGAEELFHRIAEVRTLRLLQIGADGVRMADQLQRDKGQIKLCLLQQIICGSQVLLVLHVLWLDVSAHPRINDQIFQASLECLLIIEEGDVGVYGIADVPFACAQRLQLSLACVQLRIKGLL